MIYLNLDELNVMVSQSEKIQEDLDDLVKKLLIGYDSICECVMSSGLNKKMGELKEKVIGYSSDVLNNLPATTSFLKSQIAGYGKSNENTKMAIDSLVAKIDLLTKSN